MTARCSSIDLANSAGPPGLGNWAVMIRRSLMTGSVIHHRLDVGGDALTKIVRHRGWAKQPHQPIDGQRRIAGLRDGRDIGYRRSTRGVGHRERLDLASLNLRARDGVGRLVKLHAAGSEIVRRLDRIAVGHLLDVDADVLEPALEHDVESAGQAGPVEFAGLGARQLDHVLERIDRQVGRHRNGDHGVRHPRDRCEIALLIRRIVVQVRVAEEGRAGCKQQDMVVLSTDESVIATMPSPPGRFSITIGWFHFLLSRSASNRAPMSAPLPGPSVRMNLTGRVGHDCAEADATASRDANSAARMKPEPIRRTEVMRSSDSCLGAQTSRRGCVGECDTGARSVKLAGR